MRRLAHRVRRRLYEALGNPKYTPRPSLNDLDSKLSRYLNFRGGFFIEAGANNGYKQSNTYYLERGLRWRGVLVEAIPELYEQCRRLRTRSRVFNCALVAPDYVGDDVVMHFADLMSVAEGSMGTAARQKEHIDQGLQYQKIESSYTIKVPARTLESILDEVAPRKIDLLSLDVEGYELNVLKGLNLARYRPRYILVEAWSYPEIDALLRTAYDQVDQLSFHDYLYRAKGPGSVC